MSEQKPKGRGRAGRGRARQTEEEVRRPGTEPERGGAGAAPAAVHPAQGNGGRRTHRGAPRVDPVPSEQRDPQMGALTEAMAGTSLSEMAGRGRSRFGAGDIQRPPVDKRGTSGEELLLAANLFEVVSKPSWCVYQYHCDFAPNVESVRMRRAFIKEHKDELGESVIFDGMHDLKTIRNLGENLEVFSQRNTDGENIRITIKRVAELSPAHPELQRLFNVQMRRNLMHLNFQLVGRHFFDPQAVSDVPQHNLQIWQGVMTSIRQYEEKLMMCVDTVHKVVRSETALRTITDAIAGGRGDRSQAAREIIGAIVMTRYNNKTYRVEDIDWTLSPRDKFETRNGEITYLQYYKTQYNIDIKDQSQPLLLCTSKEREIRQGASVSKKIYLIPEICLMTGLTDKMRKDFRILKEVGEITRLTPQARVSNLNRFIERVHSNPSIAAEMGYWGLQFSRSIIQFKGRSVPGERIVTSAVNEDFRKGRDFSNLLRNGLYSTANLQNWIIICTKYDESKCASLVSDLMKVAGRNGLGMNMQKPRICSIGDDRINTYLQAFKENFRKEVQLVTFIVPNDKKERYDALKKSTCLENAVPSQVIVSRTLNKKGFLSIATKIAIQINCKLGGEAWSVAIPMKRNVMIIGYDTYHDSSRKGRSAGAFVASMNTNCTKWYSRVSFHSAGGWQELSNNLALNFMMALKEYRLVNKTLPDLIILYRDGVGDGQIGYVKEWEVQQFVKTMNEAISDRQVNYAFIIVNKRVNIRFFHINGRNYDNPPHGTVIDNTVTRHDRYDFYLVSQFAGQGTVSPTLYNVIEDKSGLKPEHMQRLTYKLTHLYYNYSGTISVPAPCQYAHKLAFLAGQSLHDEPRAELCRTLFYL